MNNHGFWLARDVARIARHADGRRMSFQSATEQARREHGAPVYEGPAPSATGTTYDDAAWKLLCMRHPRRMKKVLKHLEFAERMHRYYLRRIV